MSFLRVLALVFAALAVSPFARAAEAVSTPVPYPLATCIVSDEKLGEMGKPVIIDHKGRQIGFCCKSCVGDFEKDPAKYLAKLPAPVKP